MHLTDLIEVVITELDESLPDQRGSKMTELRFRLNSLSGTLGRLWGEGCELCNREIREGAGIGEWFIANRNSEPMFQSEIEQISYCPKCGREL